MNKFRRELEIRERIISEMKTKPKETQGWINTICYALREAEDKKEKKFSKINKEKFKKISEKVANIEDKRRRSSPWRNNKSLCGKSRGGDKETEEILQTIFKRTSLKLKKKSFETMHWENTLHVRLSIQNYQH